MQTWKPGGFILPGASPSPMGRFQVFKSATFLSCLYSKSDLANVTEEELDRIVLDAVPEEG